jgi:prepilin-type N-terminal cleavage/methylation domain-containing protein
MKREFGFTFIEIIVTLAILSMMLAGGATMISRYGANGMVKHEANRLADNIWEVRADATMGQRQPCVDFPSDTVVRIYNEYDGANGYGSGDSLKGTYRYSGRVRAASRSGGGGSSHCLCFDSRGVKTGTSILKITLQTRDGSRSTLVQVNPATGLPKVIGP